MPLNTPASAVEITTQIKTDIQNEWANSNPFLPNSFAGAMAGGQGNRLFDFYLQLQQLQRSLFLDTALGADLDRLAASIPGITRNGASVAKGIISIGGSVTTLVPGGTVFVSEGGVLYTSPSDVNVLYSTFSPVSLIQVGGLATFTTDRQHFATNNLTIEITGADQAEWNGIFPTTVTSPTTLTFPVDQFATQSPTGAISGRMTFAVINVESDDAGADVNLESLGVVSLQSPIIGIDNEGGADFSGVGGGTDQEDTADLRDRSLDEMRNPVAHFNVSDITKKAREVAGVTRVFVQETTPALGQVTIYFTRDNDTDPIPSGPEVAEVKDKILEIKPAITSDNDVIVNAPTASPTDFIFASLFPNTLQMQAAVEASLEQFFLESVDVGQSINEDAYRSAIYSTVDPVSGRAVDSFTLTAPVGNIPTAASNLPTLGTVTF